MCPEAPCPAVGSRSGNIPWLLPLPKEMSAGTRRCHVCTESQADKGQRPLGSSVQQMGLGCSLHPMPNPFPTAAQGPRCCGRGSSSMTPNSSPIMLLSTLFYCSAPPLPSSASRCGAQPSAAGRAW